ncbi:MAG: hypothetical protein IJX13_08120, partial [Clostridia bacterium]|nr:hypothetical protein [Clostridia bacterium]
MKNNIFTRLISLLLAIMCLVSGAVTVVGAEGAADNLTAKSIADYKETLNTISYKDYQALYFANAATAQKELAFALTENWSYENDNIRITVQNGDWKMIVLGKAYDSAEAAAEDGCTQPLYTVSASGSVRVITETYEELADALAAKDEKGNAKYDKEDLAYVTEDYDGDKAIYTPGRGKTVWTLDFKEHGVDKATLFSIGLQYYPVVAKSTSVEREFLINGQVPFSESRSLTLSKVWSTYQQGSVNDGEKTNLIELSCTYYL